MSLSRAEKMNLGILVGGGIALALSFVAFRFVVERQRFGISNTIFSFQYAVGFVTLGVLLVLFLNSNSQLANLSYILMSLAVSFGLLLPPAFMSLEEVVLYVPVFVFVLGGGIFHYRFNRPSNTLFIGLLALLSHEIYLFGMAYCLLGFLELSNPIFVIAVLAMTVILYGIRRILVYELDKTHDNSFIAAGLEAFLAPTRKIEN